MMNLQEMKKKTYTVGTTGVRFRDPIKFVSKLNSSKRCVNEIRIPIERGEYCQSNGLDIIEDYYGTGFNDSDEENQAPRANFPLPKKVCRLHQGPVQVYHPPEVPKEGGHGSKGSKRSPGKLDNKFKFKEEVLSAIPANSLFGLALQGASAQSPAPQAATTDPTPSAGASLGKRIPGTSAPSEEHTDPPVTPSRQLTIGTPGHPHRGKYLCPRTGAYFSTLEDYRLLKSLQAREDLLKAEKELKYLRAHAELKRRKLALMLEEETHAA